MKKHFRFCFLGALFISGLMIAPALAQTETTANTKPLASATAKQASQPAPWQLVINKELGGLITLKAKEAPLPELAADLSKQTGVPVLLSPLMQKQNVTVELAEASLETVARALAPVAFMDEVVNVQNAALNQPLGIYLSGVNEVSPARGSIPKQNIETVLFMGKISDESPGEKPATLPLAVKLENGLLTIRAQREPVAAVLYEIAQQLGIPFELQHETGQLIDLDLQGYRLEDALRQCEAPVQLTRRLNLAQNDSEPLRIILLAPVAN